MCKIVGSNKITNDKMYTSLYMNEWQDATLHMDKVFTLIDFMTFVFVGHKNFMPRDLLPIYYIVYGIYCRMCNSVTYLVRRHMLGCSIGQQLDHKCNLMTLGISVLTNILVLECSKLLRGLCLGYIMSTS